MALRRRLRGPTGAGILLLVGWGLSSGVDDTTSSPRSPARHSSGVAGDGVTGSPVEVSRGAPFSGAPPVSVAPEPGPKARPRPAAAVSSGAFVDRESPSGTIRVDRAGRYAVDLARRATYIAHEDSVFTSGDHRTVPLGLSLVRLSSSNARAGLEARGLEVVEAFQPSTLLVHRAASAPQLSVGQWGIEWVRSLSADDKWLPGSWPEDPESRVVVHYLDSNSGNASPLRRRHGRRIVAAREAIHLAHLPEVFALERAVMPRLSSGLQRASVLGPDDVLVPLALAESLTALDTLNRLSEVQVEVMDSGYDVGPAPQHPQLPEPVATFNWTASPSLQDDEGHGSFLAGVVAGTGSTAQDAGGFPLGLGVARGARLAVSKVFHGGAFDVGGQTLFALAAKAAENGAHILSGSWGASANGAYTSWSQDFDRIVRDADGDPSTGLTPLIAVFAAGNAGPSSALDAPGTAKNVITVGASEGLYATATDGCGVGVDGADALGDVARLSSRGPTKDLRTKPDLVAPGTQIIGLRSQSPEYHGRSLCTPSHEPDPQLFAEASGSSVSAAVVAGAAALVSSALWERLGQFPSPALVRAVLIAHAADMEGGSGGTAEPISHAPSPEQGWGRVNVASALNGLPSVIVDQEFLLEQGGDFVPLSRLRVVDPSQPVRIVLAWTDPPGGLTGGSLVNDLNLFVTSGGFGYPGNALDQGRSQAGAEFDYRNNVEVVTLELSDDEAFDVEVIGWELLADGVPGSGTETDQDFALYVYNAAPSPECDGDEDCPSDPCTTYACEAGECRPSARCPIADQCSLGGCVLASGECQVVDKHCDDGNECTQNSCDPAEGCRSLARDDCSTCGEGSVCFAGMCGEPGDFEGAGLPPLVTTDSQRPWTISREHASSGGGSARAGRVRNDEQSWALVDLELVRSGSISFHYRVDSQADRDFFRVLLDGEEILTASGQRNWQPYGVMLPAGEHSLRFVYEKDASGASGLDTAWIDQLRVHSCATEECSITGLVDGECVVCPVQDGTACTPASPCSDGDQCQQGLCGEPRSCSDRDECTADSCDEASGICLHDGELCTDPEAGPGGQGGCAGDSCGGAGSPGEGTGLTGNQEAQAEAGGCGCRLGGKPPAPLPFGWAATLALGVRSLRRRADQRPLPACPTSTSSERPLET